MAEPCRPAGGVRGYAARGFQGGQARQPADDPDGRAAVGAGHAGSRRLFRAADADRARGRPLDLAGGRETLSRRRRGTRNPGLHRLSRAPGARQWPSRLPGTSGPARGLCLRPAQGFQGWNPQLGRQRHHGFRDRSHDRRGNAGALLIPTGIAMNKLNVWMLAALVIVAGCGKEAPPAASTEAEAPVPDAADVAEAPPAAAPAAAPETGARDGEKLEAAVSATSRSASAVAAATPAPPQG